MNEPSINSHDAIEPKSHQEYISSIMQKDRKQCILFIVVQNKNKMQIVQLEGIEDILHFTIGAGTIIIYGHVAKHYLINHRVKLPYLLITSLHQKNISKYEIVRISLMVLIIAKIVLWRNKC